MDRLEAITAFIHVVDAGGFSAAARRLGMPLATISRKVAELEARLGARLLARSTRRVTPTEAGLAFAATGRVLLERLGEAERLASGEFQTPRGLLTVAAPIVLGRMQLLPIAAGFLQAYPEVDLDLRLTQRTPHLGEDHLDLAVMIGALPDSGLRAASIGQIQPVVVASPDYIARHGSPGSPEALAGHQLITHAGGAPGGAWTFRGGARLAVRSRLAVSTAEAAVDAAVAGVGVAQLLCYQVSGAIAEGRLQPLMRSHWSEAMPVSLVHDAGRITPQKVRAFIDYVAPRLRARLTFSL